MALKIPKNRQGGKAASHARAPKQEKAVAARLGGRTVKGSGCGFEKGDVRVKGVARIEVKNTVRQSFSVTRKMIDKIETAAVASGEIPAIEIEFVNTSGELLASVAVLPTYALDLLIGGKNSSD